jgi:hypothetical protein
MYLLTTLTQSTVEKRQLTDQQGHSRQRPVLMVGVSVSIPFMYVMWAMVTVVVKQKDPQSIGLTEETTEMKVKFYKGPYHNKTKDADDSGYGIIKVAKQIPINALCADGVTEFPQPIQGSYIRTHHTHPDGSTFFVWQGWDKN